MEKSTLVENIVCHGLPEIGNRMNIVIVLIFLTIVFTKKLMKQLLFKAKISIQ